MTKVPGDAVESALFGAERAPEDTRLDQALLSLRHGVAEVAYPELVWRPIPALWAHFSAGASAAVEDDFDWLLLHPANRGVVHAFFERELWPCGAPPSWDEHVARFRERLFARVEVRS
jgi:hypothetical protein